MDRRRILGPSDAVRPVVPPPSAAAPKPQGVRKFYLKSSLSQNANGSAYLEVGDTVIEVGVFGPRPIKGSFVDRASFSVETKFLPHVTQPNEVLFNGASSTTANVNGRTGLTSIEHRVSSFVETAFLPALLLEKYPKSTIDVFVNVLSFNAASTSLPNLLAWAVNCTSLALVDSGIELRDVVTCGHVKSTQGQIVVDSLVDDSEDGSECVAGFMPMLNNDVVAFLVQGTDGSEVVGVDLQAQLKGCSEMAALVRSNLNGYLLDAVQ